MKKGAARANFTAVWQSQLLQHWPINSSATNTVTPLQITHILFKCLHEVFEFGDDTLENGFALQGFGLEIEGVEDIVAQRFIFSVMQTALGASTSSSITRRIFL